jgi:hypothetical protein
MTEQKRKLPGFIGPSYVDNNPRYDCQDIYNWYLQQDESVAGKEMQVTGFLQRPCLKYHQNIAPGGQRPGAAYTLSTGEVSIFVSGNQVYQISGADAIPVSIVGTMGTSSGPVSISDNGISVIIVDGTTTYYTFDIGTFVLNTNTSPNFYGANQVTFQDGYFILNWTGTNKIFISDLYSTNFLALNYAAKAGYPDPVVGLISNAREVFIYGTQTSETWYDQGASGSTPFVREDGKNTQIGCISAQTIVPLAGTIYYLGQNPQGGAIVYFMNGYTPTRISNHALENSLAALGDLSTSYAYGIQWQGHYWYVLQATGANWTWVFDIGAISDVNPNNGQWTKFTTTQSNNLQGPFAGMAHCVLNGSHLVFDAAGNLYTLDQKTYVDQIGGTPAVLKRQRTSPHVSNNLNRIFYKLFQADFFTGQGLVNNGTNPENAVNPSAFLEYSDDGGQTWSEALQGDLGAIGRYKARCRFSALGSARDRVFRLTVTDPVEANLAIVAIDFEVGTS